METTRIEELKRRVERDPTSIAFAQLAEEYRRTGDFQQAVDVCRDGLDRHPGYVSARVTLARALVELEQFAEARTELKGVLAVAPDNLAAIRALADIHQRAGDDEDESYTVHVTVAQPPIQTPIEAAAEPAKQSTIDEHVLPAVDLPALDALESLSIEMPALPDLSWDFDTALNLDDLQASSAFEEPAPGATFEAAPLAPAPVAAAAVAHVDPALGQLEQWLAAIVADRAGQH
jgi:tetratricopeptide (TPR) repeat protein